VIGLGLRQVQEALNRKADEVQRSFVATSEALDDIGRRLLEAGEADRKPLRAEQIALRSRQQELADEINRWREMGRKTMNQPGTSSLRAYLQSLLDLNEPKLKPAVDHALYLMDAPEDELAKLADSQGEKRTLTQAGRLLARARSEYDLRGPDTALRMRAAVEFANRPGMAQDDATLAEIEAALEDEDAMVREVATLAAVQLHRFRALRSADLDLAHISVQALAKINHPAVIPALIEIVEKQRSGYGATDGVAEERDNNRSRMVALLRLVEWHTAEAQKALKARQFDRDHHIVMAAARALELFPGVWTGPLKGTGPLAESKKVLPPPD
jgi:hypothetical protein